MNKHSHAYFSKALIISTLNVFAICLSLYGQPKFGPSDIRLPEVIGDHMVLRQNSEVSLWGWSGVGQTLEIKASWGAGCQAVADDKGQWVCKLRTPAATSLNRGLHPETITFSIPNGEQVRICDILIGEVWLCGGQSNMVLFQSPCYPSGSNMWYGEEFWGEESKKSDRPALRYVETSKASSLTPQQECSTGIPGKLALPPGADGKAPPLLKGWQITTHETASLFSAVSYYFGSMLQEKLNVPVGLISSNVGGTGIESWMSIEAIRTIPSYSNVNASLADLKGGPACLFNGMIAPLTPLKINGVIWYQGESNVGNKDYASLFKALISDWRRSFDYPGLPFYFVQIAPFKYNRGTAPAELREAQTAGLELKNTGMALTSDIGEPGNIHPKNKRDVGWRLAYQALNKTYGFKDITADGPVLHSATVRDGKVYLTFDNPGGGLVSSDGQPLTCFETCGPDGIFAPSPASITGDMTIELSPKATATTRVRFGWGETDAPNLMSKNGLPARQFQILADSAQTR